MEAGGCAVGGPTTVAGISVSQVWSSRFLSMNSGHQMALSLSFQSQGLNYLWPCVHLHLCVCVRAIATLLCNIPVKKHNASNNNKLNYFEAMYSFDPM